MAPPVTLSAAADLPFKYVGGDASIDLVNTVDWTARGLIDERLTSYDRLTRWAEGAGVVTSKEGARLRSVAAVHPRLADPPGAALFSYYSGGELKAGGSSITEGIGQGRITRNLEGLTVDFPYQIPDAETVQTVFDLLRPEHQP